MKVLQKRSSRLHYSFHHHMHRTPLKNKGNSNDIKERHGLLSNVSHHNTKSILCSSVVIGDHQKERLLQQKQQEKQAVLHQSCGNDLHNHVNNNNSNEQQNSHTKRLLPSPSRKNSPGIKYFSLPHDMMNLLRKSEDYDTDTDNDTDLDNHSIDSDQENNVVVPNAAAGCTKDLVNEEGPQNDLLQLQQSNRITSLSLEEEAIIDTTSNLKKETQSAAYSSSSILHTVSDDDDEDKNEELLQSNHSTLFSESFASSMDDLVDNTVDTINSFCVASSPKSFPTL